MQFAGGILRDLALLDDMIATSDDWGSAKPAPGFCRKMIEVSPCEPGATLYVGDRLDNDIVPAAGAGLRTALIKRGLWAVIWQDDPAASRVPTLRVDSLAELPMNTYAPVLPTLRQEAADSIDELFETLRERLWQQYWQQ